MQKKVLIQFADFAHDHVSCFIMIGTTDSHAIVSYQNPICLLTLLDFRTCLFQGVANRDAHFSGLKFLVEKREKWPISRREKTEKSRKTPLLFVELF